MILDAQSDGEEDYPTCEDNLYGTFEDNSQLRNRNDRMDDLADIFTEYADDELTSEEFIFGLQEWAVFARSAYNRFPIEELPQCLEYIHLDQTYRQIIDDIFTLSAMVAVEVDYGTSVPEHIPEQRQILTQELSDKVRTYNVLFLAYGRDSQ